MLVAPDVAVLDDYFGGEKLRQPLTKALMTYKASKNIRLPTADAMAGRPMMDMPGEAFDDNIFESLYRIKIRKLISYDPSQDMVV